MIGIITLNQDTYTNPTLYSLVKKLNDQGKSVGLFCGYQQEIPEELAGVKHFNAPKGLALPRRPANIVNYLKTFFGLISQLKKHKVKHLIAVDQQGLILAGRIQRFQKQLKIHYFSFEIFFYQELKDIPYLVKMKQKEIFYTKKVTTIIIQDTERKRLLIEENKISEDFTNWRMIPVSPVIEENINQKRFRKEDFGLQPSDTVYIHSGSIAGWAGIAEITAAVAQGLPPHTFILIHNKNKFNPDDPTHAQLFALKNKGCNLILHDEKFVSYAEYCSFLSCFDYGIVIYKPDGNNFTGMNIKEIGLSSGKFSTYMFCGLPSVLSDCKTYSNIVENYSIGVIATEERGLNYHINNDSLKAMTKKDCESFYKAVLDANHEIEMFINTLN